LIEKWEDFRDKKALALQDDALTFFTDTTFDTEPNIVNHATSLSIVSKYTSARNSIYHLKLATILIFKHAAVLCLSGIPAKLALTQADSDYQKSNIASKIEEHVTSYHVYSFEQSVDFLIATHIESSK